MRIRHTVRVKDFDEGDLYDMGQKKPNYGGPTSLEMHTYYGHTYEQSGVPGLDGVQKPPVATGRHGRILRRGTVLAKSVWNVQYGSHGPTGDREGRLRELFSIPPRGKRNAIGVIGGAMTLADPPRHYLRVQHAH